MPSVAQSTENTTPMDLTRIEFHRHALALMPVPEDRSPGVAILVANPRGEIESSCNCRVKRKKTCRHVKDINQAHGHLAGPGGKMKLQAEFEASPWHSLAVFLTEDWRGTPQDVQWNAAGQNGSQDVRLYTPSGEFLLAYLSGGPDAPRFRERCGPPPIPDEKTVTRAGILRQLRVMTLSALEYDMHFRGHKTRKMSFEESFWYHVAYHGFREFGGKGIVFAPMICEKTGEFMLTCLDASQAPICRVRIRRSRVKAFFSKFGQTLSGENAMHIHPVPLELLLDAKLTKDLDLAITPKLRMIQKNGEFKLLDSVDLAKHQYGDLVYIQELNLLADMADPGDLGKTIEGSARVLIEKSQIPLFLAAHSDDLAAGRVQMAPDAAQIKLIETYDSIEIDLQALERDWCWLSIQYGFGNTQLSLAELIRARREDKRFIATDQGWVDVRADAFNTLEPLVEMLKARKDEALCDSLKVSRLEILRINALCGQAALTGDAGQVNQIRQFLELRPPEPLPALEHLMTSSLRDYQQKGVRWLWYLWQNRLGGLLCDDMGLGKTHQIMALTAAIVQAGGAARRFLVVCPTSVMGHWHEKLKIHAPALGAGIHHGPGRDLDALLAAHQVLITSYGILLRDIELLNGARFDLAVFDEIQYLKNPGTQTYKAAASLDPATLRLGLTGTPIENTLVDLKALMDLVNPGYLGSDAAFNRRYAVADPSRVRRKELGRLVSPFTLRRLKSTVLDELPPKIEDIRTCRLSDDQVKLYQDAIASRRKGLWASLNTPGEPVPYLHIFALLTLLKQICDHPALVDGNVKDAELFESGKWELFREILAESLDSGQKVVVYSQFVGMIEIIAAYLEQAGIGHAVLTGKSRNRGKIIARFNQDPDCRVFVGSLRAGGTGIDLVAASVVIHYDRWWNAAREDQATDRVHRIGQRRGVQVFKLVTMGTLEEKIAAIIQRKKQLMETVIAEDDPDLLKTFTREELMEMLADPAKRG